MLVDSHTHLYLEQFNEDRDEVIRRAIDLGVEHFYLPNIDSASIEDMLGVEQAYPNQCFAMMGLHPCSAGENYMDELKIVEYWLERRQFVAIGETGIDLYWDTTFIEQQIAAFRIQIGWAKELGIPIVIHSRDSMDLVIEILKQECDERLRGIMHCFTGTITQAREIMEIGFYMGIGGVITFKNGGLFETVKDIPLEYLVLETDSPYLAPAPYRGKRNESSYLKLIGEKLAEAKNVSVKTIAGHTTANVEKIFTKKT